jgi:hypothetical protein
MINWKNLEADREAASRDKADLFDFYHDTWDALVAEIKRLEKELDTINFDRPLHNFGDK